MISTFRPLRQENWVGDKTPVSQRRSRGTFKAGWHDTVNLLDREVELLGAREFVIEADFREQDIRQDGMPRANARQPNFPGIRIFFESRHGPLAYQTDTCAYWQHNVRSIALGLEALRAVDRYGITHRAEQYTGFKAIGAGPTETFADVGEALDWITSAEVIGFEGAAGAEVRTLVRTLQRRFHPDRGGPRAQWDKLERAVTMLRGAGYL